MRRLTLQSLLCAAALMGGCAPDVPQNPVPATVVARYDPQAMPPDVPLPNDLAKDPATGLLAVPDGPMDIPAQLEFNAYLRTLDGFPPATPIVAKFTGALRPESVTVGDQAMAGSVVLIDLTAKSPLGPDDVAAAPSSDGKSITVAPKKQLALGHTYLAAIFGGSDPNGVKAADGSPVVGAPFTFFTRSSAPLLTCPAGSDPTCACTRDKTSGQYPMTCVPALGLTFAQAAQLEDLRVVFDGLLNEHPGVLDAAGTTRKREDVVLLWTFTIATGPFAVFDPTTGRIPMPNDVLLDQTTNKVNLPVDQNAPASQKALIAGLNKLDGFSTTGNLTLDVDTADGKAPTHFTPDESVIVFNVTSPVRQPSYSVQGETESGGNYDGLVTITPDPALMPDHSLYVAVFTKGVTDAAGRALRPSPVMQLVKSRSPLFCSGMEMSGPCMGAPMGSQVPSLLDDASAKQLEGLRLAFDNPSDPSMNLWTQLSMLKKVNRDDVAMVWAFHTVSITQDLLSIAKYPTDKNLSTAVDQVDVEPAAGKLFGQDAGDVDSLAFGKLHTHLALGADGTLDLAGGNDVEIDFLMSLPTAAKTPPSGAPIAIVQHGFTRWRGDARYIAEAFAAQGWATIAIDINYHGGRAICTSDKQCAAGGTCKPDGTCSTSLAVACDSDAQCAMGGTCNKATGACSNDFAADSSLCMTHNVSGKPVRECDPVATGSAFINLSNLFAIRDNLRQHVLDLSQVQRVLAGPELANTLAQKGFKIDGTQTAYLGQSLGGIEGTLFMAATAAPTTAVLNVPGGHLADLIANSPTFGSLLTPLLQANGLTPGTRPYFFLLNTLRWIMDPADPANFGKYLTGYLALAGAPKTVIVQEAGDDMVIGNPYTEALAREIGLPLDMAGHVEGEQADYTKVSTFFPGAPHGFLFEYPPGTGTVSGQQQAVGFITSAGATLTAP